MVYFSFLIYWKIKERKVLIEDIRRWLAVGVETSKPQDRIFYTAFPDRDVGSYPAVATYRLFP